MTLKKEILELELFEKQTRRNIYKTESPITSIYGSKGLETNGWAPRKHLLFFNCWLFTLFVPSIERFFQ